jgi:hypothetical protein
LAHALYFDYDPPIGFDFDTLSLDDAFVADTLLDTYNAPVKSQSLYDWILHQEQHYLTNDILFTMGEDFRF